MDVCGLREANGLPDKDCDGSSCVFWRLVEHLADDAPGEGCAIRHYELLGDSGVAAWLLSVKERIERERPDALGHSRTGGDVPGDSEASVAAASSETSKAEGVASSTDESR